VKLVPPAVLEHRVIAPICNRVKGVMPSAEKIDHFLVSFYQSPDGEPTRTVQQMGLILFHPATAVSAVRYIAKLPVVVISIPESDRSALPWLYDQRRPWNLRGFMSSYVELPSPLHLYWRGQTKQNLRKATARARTAGFTVRLVAAWEIGSVVAQVFKDKGWDDEGIEAMLRTLRESRTNDFCVAVFDELGQPAAFCIGTQAGDAIRNVWANASQKGQVRWLCFTGFVEEAGERGAKYLVESPPWAMPSGNRLFAQRLGFAPARIRARRSHG
jgi:hypothetical protein